MTYQNEDKDVSNETLYLVRVAKLSNYHNIY